MDDQQFSTNMAKFLVLSTHGLDAFLNIVTAHSRSHELKSRLPESPIDFRYLGNQTVYFRPPSICCLLSTQVFGIIFLSNTGICFIILCQYFSPELGFVIHFRNIKIIP